MHEEERNYKLQMTDDKSQQTFISQAAEAGGKLRITKL